MNENSSRSCRTGLCTMMDWFFCFLSLILNLYTQSWLTHTGTNGRKCIGNSWSWGVAPYSVAIIRRPAAVAVKTVALPPPPITRCWPGQRGTSWMTGNSSIRSFFPCFFFFRLLYSHFSISLGSLRLEWSSFFSLFRRLIFSEQQKPSTANSQKHLKSTLEKRRKGKGGKLWDSTQGVNWIVYYFFPYTQIDVPDAELLEKKNFTSPPNISWPEIKSQHKCFGQIEANRMVGVSFSTCVLDTRGVRVILAASPVHVDHLLCVWWPTLKIRHAEEIQVYPKQTLWCDGFCLLRSFLSRPLRRF